MTSSAAIEVSGLAKRFAGRLALLPVSFAIEEGEHLAITGPSGSGKTTLLRLLAGLLDPTAGVILQGSRTVSQPGWQAPPHQRALGMLFQGLGLWPHMTLREHVEFAIATPPGGSPPSRSERRRRAARLLAELGLEPLAGRYPAQLSGGERQRAAWARAVAGEPRLLLLDEPLTSLDPLLREQLLESMARFGELPGRTVILVTHDPRVAKRVGRRVLELGR